MGMGKTLEMISLIIADANASSPSKATLIVAPVGVMSNWSGQIAHHVKAEHALRVLTYHGSGKKPMKAEDFGRYDVVITSYGTLATEYYPPGKRTPACSSFTRLVLDKLAPRDLGRRPHYQEPKYQICIGSYKPHGSIQMGLDRNTHHK